MGAAPGQAVTVRAALRGAGGGEWVSGATFVADAAGAVDVARQAPAAGSYEGADAMGLCWSMRPGGPGAGWLPVDLRATDPLRVALTAEAAGAPVAREAFELRWLAAGVRREALTPQTAAGLAGELFLPAGAGPSPAVLTLAGSGGGAPVGHAALLASRGVAALALGYFNYPGRPAQLAEQPLEYFEQALRWLQGHPDVDRARVGVTGMSRGGELALLLGAALRRPRCVVARQPSAFVGRGVGREASARSAWSRGGRPLPFLPWAGGTDLYAPPGPGAGEEPPLAMAPGFVAALEGPRRGTRRRFRWSRSALRCCSSRGRTTSWRPPRCTPSWSCAGSPRGATRTRTGTSATPARATCSTSPRACRRPSTTPATP